MKKSLLILASAALLFAGCAKEQFAGQVEGGLTEVTFTANLGNGVATKADADNDGDGTNVNRCIMEIYFQDVLYKRMEAAMSGTPATTTFANVPVVAGKEYQILFWADHVDVVNTEAGLATDKYYTTKTTTGNKGLKAVTVNKTNFIDALKSKKNDELDAFFFADNYTVPQNPTQPFNVSLKRPFAQLNVITTDVAEGKTVTSADLLPDKVSVSYKAANKINVSTGEISQMGEVADYTYTYEAPVYGNTSNWNAVKTRGELTLSMDYILASTEQAAVDVTFKTFNNGDANPVMTHNLTNLPYKRNYRTNVKGDLLTTAGSWKATIAPAWTDEITHPVVIATTLEEAQAAVGPTTTETEAASTIIVKPEAVTNRNQTKDKDADYVESKTTGINLPDNAKAIEFILTPQSKKDVTFELPALPPDTEAEKFYWYIRHEENYPTKNLNVKVSDDDKTRVIIDAPNQTHVVLNDVEYEHVIAITGTTTLVVPQEIKVDKLTVKKGGVEIHGEVGELEITGTESEVFFRSCEGLSADVFAVIKGENHNYIDTPQYCEKLNSDGTYDIVSSVCKIGETYYGSLNDAFKAVPTDATEATVITVVADANETFEDSGAKLNSGQKAILDLNGHKLVGTSTGSGYTKYIYVENGGELTVKDSRTGGAIEYHDGYIENLTSGSGTGGSAITCHGCMTLESGTIENKTPDTYTNSLEGAIDMYTNAWGQAYSPADIVLNINGGVIKSNNANTVRLTSFSSQTYTTSVTANMNGGEVYGRDGFFIQGVSESYLNTNTLNLNGGKVYGTQAVRVMAFQNHANTSESKPVTIRIREGVDIQNNYFAQSEKDYWSEGICIDNLSGTFEQLLSYVNIITPVCKIDNSYFFSLSEAVATVGTEETTITMLRDIKFTESVNIGTKKIILNTNGMNLDATGLRAIEIFGGKLTVNGDGKFFAHNATGDNNAILNLYSGELVVNEVYLEGTNTCIGVTGGTATINNATMKALDGGCCVFAKESGVINVNGMIFTCGGNDPDGPGACWARDGGTVNVYGGTFNAVPLSNKTLEPEVLQANYCLYDYNDVTQYGFVPGHVNVYGGTFIDFNPANNYSGYSFLAEGYQSVQDGNKWIVSAINN